MILVNKYMYTCPLSKNNYCFYTNLEERTLAALMLEYYSTRTSGEPVLPIEIVDLVRVYAALIQDDGVDAFTEEDVQNFEVMDVGFQKAPKEN